MGEPGDQERSGNQPQTWSRPGEAVRLLLRGRTVRTAAPIAVVVGTLLSAINQGGVLLDGDSNALTWLRIAANYLIPFLVASAGYLAARRVPPPPPRV